MLWSPLRGDCSYRLAQQPHVQCFMAITASTVSVPCAAVRLMAAVASALTYL